MGVWVVGWVDELIGGVRSNHYILNKSLPGWVEGGLMGGVR